MKRRLPAAVLAIALATCLSLFAAKKKPDPRHPYVTADQTLPPAVNVADLAYRTALFEEITVPEKWEAKARKLANTTRDTAILRLEATHAFTLVAKKEAQAAAPQEPYFVVKANLVDYRIVGKGSRFLVGVAAGSSYITYNLEVYDGQTNTLFTKWSLATENNAFVGTFSNNDQKLAEYLGNALADFLALRARKDKGLDVVPLVDPDSKKK